MAESRRLVCEEINRAVRDDIQRFIRSEDERYTSELSALADRLIAAPHRLLVLLSGPSASGKTTTANKLAALLRERGREAYTVSLDNFYRGYGYAPLLPDGSYDYESVEALNIPLLRSCMRELLTQGCTQLPLFDFLTHAPKAERVELRVPEHAVVIFEGIHALNPVLEGELPADGRFKVFINVNSSVYSGDAPLLSGQDLRLVRRLLRDVRFRNSSPENTMDMWRQVTRGEQLYLLPFANTADVTFDTTHAYEPAMLAPELLPLLCALPKDSRHALTAERLIKALSAFTPVSTALLSKEALLREFLG